jgi:glycine dehydrogenase subunit 1
MATIPEECRFQGQLDVESALTEDELLRTMKGLASKNVSADDHPSFLGAGLYRHFCPALVDNLALRTEVSSARILTYIENCNTAAAAAVAEALIPSRQAI